MTGAHAFTVACMEPVIVRPVTFADLHASPQFAALADEYMRESANPEMGAVVPDIDAYQRAEAAGVLHFVGAYRGNDLVGYVVVAVNTSPHYQGKRVAVTESIFVASAHRRTGAGMKLLRAAEETAREAGAVALVVSAPIGGRLAQVLPRSGFRATNTFFFRGLA